MRHRSREMVSRSVSGGQVLDASCCVAEVMGTELFTLTPDTVVASALRLAAAKRIQHFLVIEDGNLSGIVCEDDMVSAPRGTLVGECMTTPVLCIGPETTVSEAAEIMTENEIDCLPVVTGAFLVGVITRDKLTHMGIPNEEQTVPDLLDEIAPDEEEEDASTCVACGSEKRVRKDVRAGLMPLCVDCAAVIPAAEPLRGN